MTSDSAVTDISKWSAEDVSRWISEVFSEETGKCFLDKSATKDKEEICVGKLKKYDEEIALNDEDEKEINIEYPSGRKTIVMKTPESKDLLEKLMLSVSRNATFMLIDGFDEKYDQQVLIQKDSITPSCPTTNIHQLILRYTPTTGLTGILDDDDDDEDEKRWLNKTAGLPIFGFSLRQGLEPRYGYQWSPLVKIRSSIKS
uniref:Uncharacterized protein n=1 Tax=Amphimedon queenslandica TaxID=400682 RepID=A0A1X7U9T5_AMPQE